MDSALMEKLRRLYEKATPGEWVAGRVEPTATQGFFHPYSPWVSNAGPRCVEVGRSLCLHADDAALIAALHNAFPEILSALQAAVPQWQFGECEDVPEGYVSVGLSRTPAKGVYIALPGFKFAYLALPPVESA